MSGKVVAGAVVFDATGRLLTSAHQHPARPAARPFHGVVVVSPNHLLGLPPKIGDTYAALRDRPPDARAGVFFVYRLP